MREKKVAIIGGGPAGLICGQHLARAKVPVTIFEKMGVCGRKLLISGSGQCNITHEGPISSFLPKYGEHGRFIKPALMNFSNTNMVEFLDRYGIRTHTAPGGKIFPEERKAVQIRDILVDLCCEAGADIRYREPVLSITRNEEGFLLNTEKGIHKAGSLVIATGGMTYPSTGSTGDGYDFVSSLGHTIVPPGPALTPVYVHSFLLRDLSGISFTDLKVTLFRNKRKILDRSGDLLITHSGLSGPVILDMSRYIQPGDELSVCFISEQSREEIRHDLTNALTNGGQKLIRTVLSAWPVPDRFIRKILDICEIPGDQTCSHLNKKDRLALIGWIVEGRFIVDRLGGPDEAMVTRGGVNLDEIHQKTMESKVVPDLYCIGELLDIDGDCGGYNLQAAFSTGILAAESILKKMGVRIDN